MTSPPNEPTRTENGNRRLQEQQDDDIEDAQEQQWPGYDHDTVIGAISMLYKTLQRMYLPPGSLVYPPWDGRRWPDNISFSPTKTKNVSNLMRYMPMHVRPKECSSLQIFEATEAGTSASPGRQRARRSCSIQVST
jgi:hypothetical protein